MTDPAQQTTVEQWDYVVTPILADRTMSVQDKINSYGRLGFELVAVVPRTFGASTYYFKRRMPA